MSGERIRPPSRIGRGDRHRLPNIRVTAPSPDRIAAFSREVPVLEYLERLEAAGEDPANYSSIWYYF